MIGVIRDAMIAATIDRLLRLAVAGLADRALPAVKRRPHATVRRAPHARLMIALALIGYRQIAPNPAMTDHNVVHRRMADQIVRRLRTDRPHAGEAQRRVAMHEQPSARLIAPAPTPTSHADAKRVDAHPSVMLRRGYPPSHAPQP